LIGCITRALHTDGAAVAAVHALHLARHQAIADVIEAGAAVALNGRAQETHGARFVHDFAVELFMAGGHQHARLQLFLAEGMGGLLNSALVIAELLRQQKRVFPVEFGFHVMCPLRWWAK